MPEKSLLEKIPTITLAWFIEKQHEKFQIYTESIVQWTPIHPPDSSYQDFVIFASLFLYSYTSVYNS